ncbi:glycosyl hydrolase [Brachybacterium sp. AOP43-C2-M15]|uniref:glycosyl hydrolase n=1 Tax=Brachybacterium sp. AOP43-C2-M15 TaxID=3457661 RepID=UPI0040346F69
MPAATVAQVLDRLDRPDPTARPMMRWWWFGPDVDEAEIDRELRAMADAGLGGAEVSFVYPLRPSSPQYLSDRAMGRLRHAAETARELGLRLDVTLGSGWSYGGAHIGPEHASRRLRWERRDLGPAALSVDLVPSWPGDEVVVACLGDGLPPSAWRPLDLERDLERDHGVGPSPDRGPSAPPVRLEIPAGRGPRTVLIAWSTTTGQQVKRSAAGAEGPVLDHLSAAATRHHLEVVGERILRAVPAELLGSVFSDSLEVYDAGWTAGLPEHFRARRGYDPLPLLHLLEVDGPGAAAFREDVGLTLSEMVEENFVAVCREWAEDHGVRFRLQGYGEPPITLSAQRGAHLIEGEGAGWTSLTQSRWASSAAHLEDRPSVSSEIWTWVHSPSFRATPLDLLGEAHEHLLLGITRFVGHGWPYSAPDAPGLGWTFYAAGALDDRNAWWPAMPELTAYLTRLAGVMSEGRPGADVALYLPYADVRAAHSGGHDLWRACRAHVGEEIPARIRRAGYDLDLVDDDALSTLDPAAYPLVVLPRVHRLPRAAKEWLDRVREAGGTVLAVDSPTYPAGVAATAPADPLDDATLVDHSLLAAAAQQAGRGADEQQAPRATADGAADPLETALRAALEPPVRVDGGGGDLGVVRRRLEDGDLYLLANTGPTTRELTVHLREPRTHLALWDPADGTRTALAADGGSLRLAPYQAMLLVADDGSGDGSGGGEDGNEDGAEVEAGTRCERAVPAASRSASVTAPDPVATPDQVAVDGWTLARGDRAAQPVSLPHLRDPAPDPDPSPMVFETTVHLTAEQLRGRIVLDLGEGTPLPPVPGVQGYRAHLAPPVREIAVVEVDGRRCGVIWRPPYCLDLTAALRPGGNRLRILVHGTTAPAAAADHEAAATVAAAHAAYGERFQQQQLERMLDGVATGLAVVPQLRLL